MEKKNNKEETLQEQEDDLVYPSLRPLDAPIPGRPRRRGHNISSSSSTSSKKKKKRKKKKPSTTTIYGIIHNIIISSKEWIIPGNSISTTTINIGIATICWYLLGVLSITTSKMLVSSNENSISLKPTWLTFQQLCIGAFLLHNVLKYNLFELSNTTFRIGSNNNNSFLSSSTSIFTNSIPFLNTSLSPATTQLFYVALFFSMGFFMTNVSFYSIVPSLVETIKAAEPISSAIIATLWKLERLGNAEIISLVTIVFGVLLSTVSSNGNVTATQSITITSFVYVITSNICFSFRGLHQKILQQTTTHGSTDDMNDVVLQYRMQCIGYLLFMIPAFVLDGFGLIYSIWNVLGSDGGWISFARFLFLSLCNGFAFASYNLASTYILSRISVVHHATLNCLRRVFAIIVTSFLFNVKTTWISWLGIVLSVVGFMSFTHYKMERKKMPKPLSTLLPMTAV